MNRISLRNKYIAKKEKEKVARCKLQVGADLVSTQQMAIWLFDYIAVIFLLTGKQGNWVTNAIYDIRNTKYDIRYTIYDIRNTR